MAKGGSLLYAIIGILVLSILIPSIISQNKSIYGEAPYAGNYAYYVFEGKTDKATCTAKCNQIDSLMEGVYDVTTNYFSYNGRCTCKMAEIN